MGRVCPTLKVKGLPGLLEKKVYMRMLAIGVVFDGKRDSEHPQFYAIQATSPGIARHTL